MVKPASMDDNKQLTICIQRCEPGCYTYKTHRTTGNMQLENLLFNNYTFTLLKVALTKIMVFYQKINNKINIKFNQISYITASF